MSLTILDSSPAYPGPPLSSPSFLVLIVDMILLLFLIERAIGRKKLNRPMPRGETLAGTISLVLAIFSSSVFWGKPEYFYVDPIANVATISFFVVSGIILLVWGFADWRSRSERGRNLERRRQSSSSVVQIIDYAHTQKTRSLQQRRTHRLLY